MAIMVERREQERVPAAKGQASVLSRGVGGFKKQEIREQERIENIRFGQGR